MSKPMKITDGVQFIPGQDEFIPDSHVFLIGNPESNDLTLVDAGLVGKGSYKVESILKTGVPLESIKRVVMTHTHLDHIGCLSELLNRMPWLEVWVHALEAEPLEKGDERTVYGMEMFRTLCQNQYGLRPGAFACQVHHKLQDGETLAIGGMEWEVVHIPGHSMGGIALYGKAQKILIPGDVIYADYAIGRFDLHGADASALKGSLMKLAELDVGILLPGHNRIMQKVPRGYIPETARQWEGHLR